jgi:hypothetical protein
MSRNARLMAGIILITIPTIQYGGYFPLTSLMNRGSGYMDNPLRQNSFPRRSRSRWRNCDSLTHLPVAADFTVLPAALVWVIRVAVPLSAILISAGFFPSMTPPNASQPNGLVSLIYLGAVILALAIVALGIGLLRTPVGC